MNSSDTPLISVIICTYSRHESLQRALESVWLQDLKDTDVEVIVVDDGSDRPVDLPPPYSDRVRLIRTEHCGVGAARSAGLNAAKGTFVAYCDDDDEWKPNHLSALLNYLLDHPDVDLVYGDSEWMQEGVPPAVAYSIDHDAGMLSYGNYIFASDVLHRAGAAREVGGFDASLQAYEDWDLWLRISQRHVIRHLRVTVGAHHWHTGCVSAGNHVHTWVRVNKNHESRMGSGGVAQYALIPEAAPSAPFDPATWQPGRRELIWHSQMASSLSFSYTARPLVLALERLGVDITMAPTRNQPPPGFERFYKPLDNWGKLAFYYDHWAKPSVLKSKRTIAYLMWESTGVPRKQVREINRAAVLLYVPCQQNAESYRDRGVRVPIKVLHHGVDPERFPYLERSRDREVFTFGSFGEFSPRKGIDVLIRAFQDEFRPHEPVRLLLKTVKEEQNPKVIPPYRRLIKDPRIELFSKYLQHDELLEFLRRMDAFVLPSRGEGFGLSALEAMSTGLPLIATNWSGPVEYLDPADSFPLSYRLVDVRGTVAHGVHFYGQWAEPDYEHLRYLMRYLYEHPDEAAEKGRIAARRAHTEWTRDRLARQVCDDFDEVASW